MRDSVAGREAATDTNGGGDTGGESQPATDDGGEVAPSGWILVNRA